MTGRALVRRAAWAIALIAGLVFPFAFPDFQIFQVNLVIVYAIVILGLNLLTGQAGQVSVGHGALFAIGAYATAILTVRYHVPYLLTIPVGAGLGFFVGLLLGLPALRIRGIYLGLVTLAIAVAFPPVVQHYKSFTGGPFGLNLPQVVPPFQLSLNQWIYLVSLVVLVLGLWAARHLVRSRVGRALAAIRQEERMAAAMGVDVRRYKIVIFAISAAYAGVAGSLYALLTEGVSPDAFAFTLSITLLVGAVVGGVRSIVGALIGGAFVVLLPAAATRLPNSLPQLLFAAAMLLVIYLQPQGLVGFAEAVERRVRAALGARESSVEPGVSDPYRSGGLKR